MVLGKKLHAIERVDAGFRDLQGFLADIGRIEQGSLFQPFLPKEDDEGIELFAMAAPRHPDFQRRVGPKMRNDLIANRAEIVGIAKHFADLDREIAEQLRQHVPIVQQALLQAGDCRNGELFQRLTQAPLDRGHGIAAEIVVVARIKRFQQQADLDVLDFLHHGRIPHRGIQTRTSDSSFSTSSGFAM